MQTAYSPKEASKFLSDNGISYCARRLRQLVRKGKLPRLKACKGRIFIPVVSLASYFGAATREKETA